VILWVLVAGFAGMTLWRLSEAIWGTNESGGRKPAKRLANLARAVFYAWPAPRSGPGCSLWWRSAW
jgi:hypothetical protein